MHPSRPRRSRRRDVRPDEIIRAALAEFTRRGYAATRLEDVAAAAGIGKGTVYLHFATKQDLFEAVVRQELLPNLAAAEALVAGHAGPSAELFYKIAAFLQRVLQSDVTAIPKLVITEAGNFPGLARFYADTVVRRGLALLAAVIERGVARGEFRPVDPAGVAPLFFAPVLMMMLWKHSLGAHTDLAFAPERLLDAHVDLFLRGLAAGPAAAPACSVRSPEPPP